MSKIYIKLHMNTKNKLGVVMKVKDVLRILDEINAIEPTSIGPAITYISRRLKERALDIKKEADNG